METDRHKWAARCTTEMSRLGAVGTLQELVAFALELWTTHCNEEPETVARQQHRPRSNRFKDRREP